MIVVWVVILYIKEKSDLWTVVRFSSIRLNESGQAAVKHLPRIKGRSSDNSGIGIIKKIFDETYLSIPYQGGISSYSLVLMVSAYLNRYDEDKD